MTTIEPSHISSGMAALLSAVELESSQSQSSAPCIEPADVDSAQNAQGNACMSKTEAKDAAPPTTDYKPSAPTNKSHLKKRWLEREDSHRSAMSDDACTEVTAEDSVGGTSCAGVMQSATLSASDSVICATSTSASDPPAASTRVRGSVMDDGRSYRQECEDARSSASHSNRPMKKRRHCEDVPSGDNASSITSDDLKPASEQVPGPSCASKPTGQTPSSLTDRDDDQHALQKQQALLSKIRRQASSRIAASLQLGRALSLSSSSSSSTSSDSPSPTMTSIHNPMAVPSASADMYGSGRRRRLASTAAAAARSRRALRAHYAQDAAQLLAGVENMRVSANAAAAAASNPSMPAPSSDSFAGGIANPSMSSQPLMPASVQTMTPTTAAPINMTTTAPIVQSLTSHYELNRRTSDVVSSAIEALQSSQSLHHLGAHPIAPMPQLDAVLRRRRMSLDAVSATSRTRLAVEAGIVVGTNKRAAAAATGASMQRHEHNANVGMERPATIAGVAVPYYLQRVTAGGAGFLM